VDRFYLLAPALVFAGAFLIGLLAYCGLYAVGRPPRLEAVKHNQLFGPFISGFLVWFIGPVERMLVGRVSPNFVTAVSLLLCAITGVTAAVGWLGAAVWLYASAGILDVLDGRLARLSGQQTAAGALFDSVSDRWGEIFVFAGYVWYLHDSPWMIAVIGALGASMMVSYTRARAEGLGIQLSGGMMQRAERIVLVSGGTLIATWYGTTSEVAPILGSTMLICTLSTGATAINRWIMAFRELSKRAAEPVVLEEPAAMPLPPRIASLSKPDLRKVRPLEQH
jgi:CDP-diacylglycerol---glycerol-3-phosphate 3-phosphatidyltransferase